MLKTVGELLDAIQEGRRRSIDDTRITQGPTIGGVYEGLTRKVLQVALPQEANLHVGQGFVRFADGSHSPQVDCLVSLGPGRKLPEVEVETFAPEQVVAIVEVKKRLYRQELIEGVEHLAKFVRPEFAGHWDHSAALRNAFRRVLRRPPPERVDDLPPSVWEIHRLLESEVALPPRILVGHSGFKTGAGLHRVLDRLLPVTHSSHSTWAPSLFPTLVVCPGLSVCKTLAGPWYLPRQSPNSAVQVSVYAEGRSATTALLDLLWSRLQAHGYGGPHWFAPERYVEGWNPLTVADFSPRGGWIHKLAPRGARAVRKLDSPLLPVPVSDDQITAILYMTSIGPLDVSIFDEDGAPGRDAMLPMLFDLQAKGLAGPRFGQLDIWEPLLPTIGFSLEPDGQSFAGDNAFMQFWQARFFDKGIDPNNTLWIRTRKTGPPLPQSGSRALLVRSGPQES